MKLKSGEGEEVVRSVDIVLHLANGTSEVYKAGEEKPQIVAQEDVPEEVPSA